MDSASFRWRNSPGGRGPGNSDQGRPIIPVTAQAASLAERYLAAVLERQEEWRARVKDRLDLRSDAAAWAVIEALPGYPVISTSVATAVTGRSKSSTSVAIGHLVDAGVLIPLSESKRNRAWEADGLFDLLAVLERAGG